MNKTLALSVVSSLIYFASFGSACAADADYSSASSKALDAYLMKDLALMQVTCVPDAEKVILSGALETFPSLSALPLLTGAFQDILGMNPAYNISPQNTYGATFDNEGEKNFTSFNRNVSNAILGGPVSARFYALLDKATGSSPGLYHLLYGAGPSPLEYGAKENAAYAQTRTFYHESFDAKYGSRCSKVEADISAVIGEMKKRKNNIPVSSPQQSSAMTKGSIPTVGSSMTSPVQSVSGRPF